MVVLDHDVGNDLIFNNNYFHQQVSCAAVFVRLYIFFLPAILKLILHFKEVKKIYTFSILSCDNILQ